MADTDPITNDQDYIDSRDVIARIDYLEGQEELDEDEREELTKLGELTEEAGGASDWQYGEQLIRDSYFEDYAEEMADGIGAVPTAPDGSVQWPLMHIDWKAAAESLQMDYTEIDFDGVTYWIRW